MLSVSGHVIYAKDSSSDPVSFLYIRDQTFHSLNVIESKRRCHLFTIKNSRRNNILYRFMKSIVNFLLIEIFSVCEKYFFLENVLIIKILF